MPSVRPRRGNPYRDAYGRMASRQVGVLTRIARNAGLDYSYYIQEFCNEAIRRGFTAESAALLTVNEILAMSNAPSWIASRARRRSTGSANNAIVTTGAWSAPTSQVYDIGLSTGAELRENLGFGGNFAASMLANVLNGTASTDSILDTPGAFEDVLDLYDINLWRVDTTNDSQVYWLQVHNGDRFALRRSVMAELFAMFGSDMTDSERRSWIDDYAYDADILLWTVESLLDRAQGLGIPNYERGRNIGGDALAQYYRDDADSLREYVDNWQRAANDARCSFGNGTIANCHCPECRYINSEINYGTMLRLRAEVNGASVEYPGWPSVSRSVRDPNDYSRPIRTAGNGITLDSLGIDLSTMPSRSARSRGSVTAARPGRQEGYYNDRGDWVVGRRPAAWTRLRDGSMGRGVYEYDSFASPENFEADEYDFEELNGGEGRADRRDRYGIAAWNYRQPLVFHGKAANGVFLGFELEINSEYQHAMIPNDVPYIGCVKHDGSINGGFEIVSQPLSFEFAMAQSFDWIPALRDAGAHAGRNGLHVHISRDGFSSDWHRYKFVSFLSDPNNYPEIRAWSRRHNAEYANPMQALTNYRMARRIGVGNGSRYVLCNVQNTATIEIRSPASTLNRIKIKGTIATLAALVEYTRRMNSTEIALGALHWSAFIAWMVERPEYAPAVRYLEALLEEGADPIVFPQWTRELVSV